MRRIHLEIRFSLAQCFIRSSIFYRKPLFEQTLTHPMTFFYHIWLKTVSKETSTEEVRNAQAPNCLRLRKRVLTQGLCKMLTERVRMLTQGLCKILTEGLCKSLTERLRRLTEGLCKIFTEGLCKVIAQGLSYIRLL